jgi:hypothetical protein
MTIPQISRRSLLAAAAVAVVARPAAAAAATSPRPKPRAHAVQSAAVRQDVQGQQGNAYITVSLTPEQDVAAIRYMIANVGTVPDTFTVWYTDMNNGRQSRKLTYTLGPSEFANATVYGSLNHIFLINVCQSDGTCFTVGPIGPAAQIAGPAHGLTAGPKQMTAGPNIGLDG